VQGVNRFGQNLRWAICALGWTWQDFGESAYKGSGIRGDSARRKVARLASGDVRVRLDDLERFAGLLQIPPVVLGYGTPDQMRAAWIDRARHCEACGERWCTQCEQHWALCGCPGDHDGDVIDCPAEPRIAGLALDRARNA